MSTSHDCPALFEACSLSLYDRNIFRLTGLPVDATARDITKQAQKLQMMEEMGGDMKMSLGAYAPNTAPTTEEIREAIARMKDPEQRIIDEFFWFWPEKFGEKDEAIEAAASGDGDKAYQIWRERENNGSQVAAHNVAVLYHMFAIEWTTNYIDYEINQSKEDTIKTYWSKAFQRWEKLIDADDVWDALKARIRSYDDHALTTGYARKVKMALPEALDKINAEAALKLAERNRLDWAQYHIDFMRETHAGLDDVENTAETILEPSKKRVNHYIETFKKQSKDSPASGAELAEKLLSQCAPIMRLYDLFHGEDSHQRNDLFDQVAETVLVMVISHQKTTGDNASIVSILKRSLEFATSTPLRERIIKNISIGEGNLDHQKLKPFFDLLASIEEGKGSPSQKFSELKQRVIPKTKQFLADKEKDDSAYTLLHDTLAIALRGISVAAYNEESDFSTATDAIKLALEYAKSEELKKRIRGDIDTLNKNKEHAKCAFCGSTDTSEKFVYNLDMNKLHEYSILSGRKTFKTLSLPLSRCSECHKKHSTFDYIGGAIYIASAVGFAGFLYTLGDWAGFFIGLLMGFLFIGAIVYLVANFFLEIISGQRKARQHESVRKLLSDGWSIGKPSR